MIKDYCGSLYGNYRQKKFTDVYPSVDKFMADYGNVGVPTTIKNELAETLFYLLYGKYGNSTIASSDLTRFKYRLFSIIWEYGPTWEKKLDFQKVVRAWQDAEILAGGDYSSTTRHSITTKSQGKDETTGNTNSETNTSGNRLQNYADNPSTEPAITGDEPLTYINRQDYGKDASHQTGFTGTAGKVESQSQRGEEGNNSLTSNRKRGRVDSYLALWDLLADDVTEKFLSRFKTLFIKFVQPEVPLWYITNEEEEE